MVVSWWIVAFSPSASRSVLNRVQVNDCYSAYSKSKALMGVRVLVSAQLELMISYFLNGSALGQKLDISK